MQNLLQTMQPLAELARRTMESAGPRPKVQCPPEYCPEEFVQHAESCAKDRADERIREAKERANQRIREAEKRAKEEVRKANELAEKAKKVYAKGVKKLEKADARLKTAQGFTA